MTPETALEKAIQLIKGGFSFQAKKELGSNMEIWRRGFADHRIRDFEDFDKHRHYIHLNPVKKHLCANPAEYKFSSAYPGWKLDPIPQGLKPTEFLGTVCGTTEVVPFQRIESETAQVLVETSGRVLKGHDFSRAIEATQVSGALAPEGEK
jgi:putative transposase